LLEMAVLLVSDPTVPDAVAGVRNVVRILDFDQDEGDTRDFGGRGISEVRTVGVMTYVTLDGPDREMVIANLSAVSTANWAVTGLGGDTGPWPRAAALSALHELEPRVSLRRPPMTDRPLRHSIVRRRRKAEDGAPRRTWHPQRAPKPSRRRMTGSVTSILIFGARSRWQFSALRAEAACTAFQRLHPRRMTGRSGFR
jgi:hypothetical protein